MSNNDVTFKKDFVRLYVCLDTTLIFVHMANANNSSTRCPNNRVKPPIQPRPCSAVDSL